MPRQTQCSFCGADLLVKMYYYRYRKKQLGREPEFFCRKDCHTNSMKKNPKQKSRSKNRQKNTVQGYVNKYARLRDCGGPDGGASCISCGKYFPYAEMDGGHFIATTSSAIRFDPRNVNAQCRNCNRFLHGNQRHYYKGMLRKYGKEIVEELESKEFESKRWTTEELEAIKDEYRERIKRLERGEPPAEVPDHSGLAVLDLFTGVDETG